MKKQFYLFASAMLLFGMTACEKKTDIDDVIEKVTVTATYDINGGADELSVFTISATYTDATGKETTEAVNSLPWTKKVEKIPVPVVVYLKVTYAKKATIPDKEVYALGEGFGIFYTITDGQSGGSSSSPGITVTKSRLEDYINTVVASSPYKTKYEFLLFN
jgi:hypothetical protein